MQKNVGQIDRAFRVIAAGLIGVLYTTNSISGVPMGILAIASMVFLASSVIGSCPMYSVLKISTNGTRTRRYGGTAQ
jgi:DUF2892 family protein